MSASQAASDAPRGHPPGLALLFITEMWERFSFYGMKALLTIYLIKATLDGGMGWTKEQAGNLMGWYGGLVYLTPIFGGYLADRFLGTHRCLLIGGSIIALGHFTLAIENSICFFLGLLLVVLGTGFFKSNVSTMVGQLYKPGDGRRDAAFTIFYMGINLGGFIAPLLCGFLRVKYGWNWGFSAAGFGMTLGLIVYAIGRPKYLAGVGDPPAPLARAMPQRSTVAYAGEPARLTREEKDRVLAILLTSFFVVFFWTAFEQAGTSMAFFAEERTDRTIPTWLPEWFIDFAAEQAPPTAEPAHWGGSLLIDEAAAFDPPPASAPDTAATGSGAAPSRGARRYPAEFFQSINSLFIILLAPLFAWAWTALRRSGREPSTPMKMAVGLLALSFGFVFMVVGARLSDAGVRVSGFWLTTAFLFITCGELCISPVGLSLVTKLAPLRFASALMGVWFLANFVANFTAGRTAGQIDRLASGPGFLLGGQADFFLLFVIVPALAGILMLALVPWLRRLMHGRA